MGQFSGVDNNFRPHLRPRGGLRRSARTRRGVPLATVPERVRLAVGRVAERLRALDGRSTSVWSSCARIASARAALSRQSSSRRSSAIGPDIHDGYGVALSAARRSGLHGASQRGARRRGGLGAYIASWAKDADVIVERDAAEIERIAARLERALADSSSDRLGAAD